VAVVDLEEVAVQQPLVKEMRVEMRQVGSSDLVVEVEVQVLRVEMGAETEETE
jgi:hypothetical protein